MEKKNIEALFIGRKDIRKDSKNIPIQELTYHDLRVPLNEIEGAALIIYFEPDEGTKIFKSKWTDSGIVSCA